MWWTASALVVVSQCNSSGRTHGCYTGKDGKRTQESEVSESRIIVSSPETVSPCPKHWE